MFNCSGLALRTRQFLLASMVIVAGSSLLRAQASATTGILRGSLADSLGNPVGGATVTLHNLQTNTTRIVRSSPAGVFVAALLPLGSYELDVRAIGFAPAARSGIPVGVSAAVEVAVVLKRTAVELAAVRVSDRSETPVSTTKTELATELGSRVVSGLPNNGRNFLALTLLTPNVAVTQGPDGDVLSVAGQRGIFNNISVDGADYNNPFFGEQRGGQRPAFTFNLDAVQEMVVTSQGANAEFGRSAGGFVNVVTKSGTNSLGGTLH